MDLKIGSRAWWVSESLWGSRSIIDTISRLLEQEEISRAKAKVMLLRAALEEIRGFAVLGNEDAFYIADECHRIVEIAREALDGKNRMS